MKWWDQMSWSLFSECWALSQLFPLSSFTFIKRLFIFCRTSSSELGVGALPVGFCALHYWKMPRFLAIESSTSKGASHFSFLSITYLSDIVWVLKNYYQPLETPGNLNTSVWRRLLRVPWTARRSNQSILKEISPGCSLEGLMLKLKLPVLWPPDANSWFIWKDPDAGKEWRQ